MQRGFRKPAPSHASQPIATLPSAKDFLDAAANALDPMVPAAELLQRVIARHAPHGRPHDARRAAACAHRRTEHLAAIGAVGIDLARIARQSAAACTTVVNIPRCDIKLFNQSGVGVGPDMRLVTMNRAARAVTGLLRIGISFAR